MQCAESLRTQAYFDGEIDAVGAAQVEQHLEHCPECRDLLEGLERMRTEIRRHSTYSQAPLELRTRIMRALDQETAVAVPQSNRPAPSVGGESSLEHGSSIEREPSLGRGERSLEREPPLERARSRRYERSFWRTRSFWAGVLGGGGLATAATLGLVFLSAPLASSLPDEILASHVRSLMPNHLIDVQSTDQHTVKPWFAGHADVSPVVADFSQQGYRLIGGRADYFDRQRPAVTVYQHGPHIINVFSWAPKQQAVPENMTRNGYHMAFWRSGDLEYCAVSDTGWDELLGLVRLLRELSARNDPPRGLS